MLECMVNFTLVEHAYGAMFRPPLGEPGYARLLTRWRKPYRTLDGYVCVVPYSTKHWESFFAEAGQPALMQDERFSTQSHRTRNIDALYAELAHCLAQRTTAEWLQACTRLDIPAAPINRLNDLESDPHLAATNFFVEMEGPGVGRVVLPRAPLRFDGITPVPSLPPRLGEHTVSVLQESGLTANAIQALLDHQAAVQHQDRSEE